MFLEEKPLFIELSVADSFKIINKAIIQVNITSWKEAWQWKNKVNAINETEEQVLCLIYKRHMVVHLMLTWRNYKTDTGKDRKLSMRTRIIILGNYGIGKCTCRHCHRLYMLSLEWHKVSMIREIVLPESSTVYKVF